MNALLTDTIAALATPPGRSSVAMFRVSGPAVFAVCDTILRSRKPSASYPTRTLHRARVVDPDKGSETVDDVFVAVFHAPHSYTGEDVAEITCHGGEIPIRRTLQLLMAHGARLAEPGEFTLRAYLNGKLDLAQAEAVADMIDARTDEAHHLAKVQQAGRLSSEVNTLRDQVLGVLARIEATIDFPEDVGEFPSIWAARELTEANHSLQSLIRSAGRGMLIRDGARVALIGSPNAGKSSLLNALLRRDRAIVTAVPGTTRDVIEESIVVNGVVLRLSDTAGIRESSDEVERLGIDRSRAAATDADVVVWVRDASLASETTEDSEMQRLVSGKPLVVAWNKVDLLRGNHQTTPQSPQALAVSALRGFGIEELEQEIARLAMERCGSQVESESASDSGSGTESGRAVVTHARHLAMLREASDAVARALQALDEAMPLDFVSIEAQTALDALGAVTGQTAPQDVIGEIFSKFCIGK